MSTTTSAHSREVQREKDGSQNPEDTVVFSAADDNDLISVMDMFSQSGGK